MDSEDECNYFECIYFGRQRMPGLPEGSKLLE